MPWDIKTDESGCSGFAVVKRDDGEIEGCHDTRAEAKSQMAALYAAEEKGMEKEQTEDKMVDGMPGGPTSFAELDALDQAREAVVEVGDLTHRFQMLAGNIMYADDIEDKAAALGTLAEEYTGLVGSAMSEAKEASKEKGLLARLKEKIIRTEAPESSAPASESGFTVWKEAGRTHWLAIYSNNYRDDDNPPEIISKEAHEDFVKAVDAGDWPAPELWYWHIPGARLGQSELVAFDADSGMSLAAGVIDKGMEPIVERIQAEPHLVSHGMPSKEIRRDDDDPTVITRYRSREISLLPAEVTANRVTAYLVKEGESMQIPQEKLDKAAELGFDTDEIQARLAQGKEQADAEGRESKEVELEVAQEPIAEAPEVAPEIIAPPALTAEDIAAAVGAVINPITERIAAMEEQIKELSERPEPEPPAEKELDLTPAASLATLIRSNVIGQEATRVDGRSKEARDGPQEHKEAQPPETVATSSVLLNNVLNDILDPQSAWLNQLPGRRSD